MAEALPGAATAMATMIHSGVRELPITVCLGSGAERARQALVQPSVQRLGPQANPRLAAGGEKHARKPCASGIEAMALAQTVRCPGEGRWSGKLTKWSGNLTTRRAHSMLESRSRKFRAALRPRMI